MQTDHDLFVVRTRMAADRTRAATESLARAAGGNRSGSGARAWLGRHLVATGMALAGERPAPKPTTTTGHSR